MRDQLNHNYDREIRLCTLIRRTLEKWRIILIAALIFCVLGAGYRYWKLRGVISGTDVASAQEQYEKALASYETDRDSYQKTIKKVRADLQAKREYLNSSILAEIDPYEEAVAEFDLFTYAVEGVSYAGATVIAEYTAFLNHGVDWTVLAEEMGTEARFLAELVTVENENGSIHVLIRHTKEEHAERIAEHLMGLIPDKEKEMLDAGLIHELQVGAVTTSVIADRKMFSWLNSRINEINTLQNNLSKTEDAAQKLTRPEAPAGLFRRDIYKSLLKYGMAGLVGGAVLMALFIALALVTGGRLLSAEDMNRTFGLRNIAVLPKNMRRAALDRFIARRDREQGRFASEEMRLQAAAENLRQFTAGMHKVLLTGSLSERMLEEVAEKLNIETSDVMIKICPQEDAAIFRAALRDADGVVVAEQKGLSRIVEMESYIALIRDWEKPIAGSICVY